MPASHISYASLTYISFSYVSLTYISFSYVSLTHISNNTDQLNISGEQLRHNPGHRLFSRQLMMPAVSACVSLSHPVSVLSLKLSLFSFLNVDSFFSFADQRNFCFKKSPQFPPAAVLPCPLRFSPQFFSSFLFDGIFFLI